MVSRGRGTLTRRGFLAALPIIGVARTFGAVTLRQEPGMLLERMLREEPRHAVESDAGRVVEYDTKHGSIRFIDEHISGKRRVELRGGGHHLDYEGGESLQRFSNNVTGLYEESLPPGRADEYEALVDRLEDIPVWSARGHDIALRIRHVAAYPPERFEEEDEGWRQRHEHGETAATLTFDGHRARYTLELQLGPERRGHGTHRETMVLDGRDAHGLDEFRLALWRVPSVQQRIFSRGTPPYTPERGGEHPIYEQRETLARHLVAMLRPAKR